MSVASFSPGRRGLLCAAGATALVTACGGGSAGDDGPPAIIDFSADRAQYFVGEQATLQVRYRGASARIEPEIGAVADGAVVQTAPLPGRRRLRLVVESPGLASVERDLWLEVQYRDRWQVVAQFVASSHASVGIVDGSIIVTGGSRGLGVPSDAVDRFDPATRRFQRIGTLATGRLGHSAVALGGSRLLVLGGNTTASVMMPTELVDGDSGAVTPSGTLIQPRNRHAAIRLGDNRVLVSGGVGRNSAEVWDPRSGQWRLLASRMAHDREQHSMTALADGRVLIAGGASVAGDYVFAELFDPRTDTFTPLPNDAGVARRWLHAAHLLPDQGVLLLGGEGVGGGAQPFDSVLRFDPASNRFTAQPALTPPRTVCASTALPGGALMLVSGQTDDQPASPGSSIWQSGVQRAVAPLPGGRLWHSAHTLLDGRVLVIGGEDGAGNYTNDTLLYE